MDSTSNSTKGRLSLIARFIKLHPSLSVTLLIAYFSCLGVTYQYYFLIKFGLSVLDFIAPQDFLLAFIQAIPTLAFIFLMHFVFIVPALIAAQQSRQEEKFIDRLIRTWKTVWKHEITFSFFMSFLLAGLAGNLYAKSIISNGWLVELFPPTCIILDDNRNSDAQWSLISSTTDYLFLFQNDDKIRVVQRKSVPSAIVCDSQPHNGPTK